VSAALLPYVADKTCARAAWEQLALLQRSPSAEHANAEKNLLEAQLLTLKKLASEDVQAYVGRAQKIQWELRSIGESPSEEHVIQCVLRGLPGKFANVRDTMLCHVGALSLPWVMANLMLAEEQIGKKQLEESTALKAVESFDRYEVKCFRCHKRGHCKRDCPSGKRSHESSGPEGPTAVAGPAGGGTGDSGSFEWVVCSGATHHILSEPWRAGKIQPSDVRVQMVNGDDVSASGVCVIDMETQVGDKTVVLHLSNVLVVPGAPYNLLSLNAMMKKGAGVRTRPDGAVVISKPDRGVVGVAHMKRGLPILACSLSKTSAA
jgi:gag-polypeptide of LTR copia-type